MKKFISAKMINLADPRIGSKIIFKTDDFFAAAHRILNIETPVFKDGLFDNCLLYTSPSPRDQA